MLRTGIIKNRMPRSRLFWNSNTKDLPLWLLLFVVSQTLSLSAALLGFQKSIIMNVIKLEIKAGLIFDLSCLLLVLTEVIIANIVVYSQSGFRDPRYFINREDNFTCTNLPLGFAKNVSSLQFYLVLDWPNDCVSLHSEENCNGESIEIILEKNPFLEDLFRWDFGKNTVSVGTCKNPCDLSITGPPPDPEQALKVEIFKLSNYKGPSEVLNVKGCTLIPREFVGFVRGIKTNNTCFELHDTPDCYRTLMQHMTLEVRPYIPYQDDLHFWDGWKFYQARAISHCSYKCDTEKYFIPQEKPDRSKIGKTEITVYDYENYLGNWMNVDVRKCKNFSKYWRDNVRSVVTYGNCVSLYRGLNCEGTSVNLNTGDDSNQQTLTFMLEDIKSAKYCIDVNDDTNGNEFNENDSGSLIIYIFGALGIAFVKITGAVLVFIFIKRRKNRTKVCLSAKEVEEFINGVEEEDAKALSANLTGHDILYYGLRNHECTFADKNYVKIHNLPMKKSILIQRKQFNFETRNLLGKGEFGKVYRGILKSKCEENTEGEQIAIKTLSRSCDVESLRLLMKEVKLFMYVENHQRLVKMMGCCLENLTEGQLFLLLEYCENGSLEKFLNSNKSTFVNLVEKGKLVTGHLNIDQSLNEEFNYFRLSRWCKEIAEGMEYLSLKQIVHGDLATRNILLDEALHVKITDFGLSKKLRYSSTQYKLNKSQQIPLPWRWLPIETLQNLEFTLKSDVWAFGVTCWEIFTLGEIPYSGVMWWGPEFIRNLAEGMRLRKPKYSTTEWYNLMLNCWEEEGNMRPSFSQILNDIIEIDIDLV